MRCPDIGRLAALAAGDDDVLALVHADDCARCRDALAGQRAIRQLAARLPAPSLAPRRRDALAAEVMAHADAADVAVGRRRSRRWLVAGTALTAAATVAVLLRGGAGPVVEAPVAIAPAAA